MIKDNNGLKFFGSIIDKSKLEITFRESEGESYQKKFAYVYRVDLTVFEKRECIFQKIFVLTNFNDEELDFKESFIDSFNDNYTNSWEAFNREVEVMKNNFEDISFKYDTLEFIESNYLSLQLCLSKEISFVVDFIEEQINELEKEMNLNKCNKDLI